MTKLSLSFVGQPGRDHHATIYDGERRPFDWAALSFRSLAPSGPRERPPAAKLDEVTRGHFSLDLANALPALHDATGPFLIEITRDDTVVAIYGNVAGSFSSRDDWYRLS